MVYSTDLYADDTTIYDIQYDVNVLEHNLQLALSTLAVWCTENRMRINIDKTKFMLVSTQQKKSQFHFNLINFSFTGMKPLAHVQQELLHVK